MAASSHLRFRNTALAFEWIKDGGFAVARLVGVKDDGHEAVYELELWPNSDPIYVLSKRIRVVEIRHGERRRPIGI